MRSIKRRFENVSRKNPYWSSYICFAEGIKGQNFNKKIIYFWFNKLIDKTDYSKTDKRVLVEQLWLISNQPEESMN